MIAARIRASQIAYFSPASTRSDGGREVRKYEQGSQAVGQTSMYHVSSACLKVNVAFLQAIGGIYGELGFRV